MCPGFTHGDVRMCGSTERDIINPEWLAAQHRRGSKKAKETAAAAGCGNVAAMLGMPSTVSTPPKRIIKQPKNALPVVGGDTDSVFVGVEVLGELAEAVRTRGIDAMDADAKAAIEGGGIALAAAVTHKVNGALVPPEQHKQRMEFEECFMYGGLWVGKKMYVANKSAVRADIESVWGTDKCGDQWRRLERLAAALPAFQKKRGMKLVKGSTPRAIVLIQSAIAKLLCVRKIDMAIDVAQTSMRALATHSVPKGSLADQVTRRQDVYTSSCTVATVLEDPIIASQFPVGAKLPFLHVPPFVKARASMKKSEGMCLLADVMKNGWPYDVTHYQEVMMGAFNQVFRAVWPEEVRLHSHVNPLK